MRIMGIDPGASGAFSLIVDNQLIYAEDMPTLNLRVGKRDRKRVDGHALAIEFRSMRPDKIFIESVWAPLGASSSSAFSFGQSYGVILGCIDALQIPYTLVTPQRWKKDMSVTSAKESSLARAKQLWPEHAGDLFKLKKNEARAEAALIAQWGQWNTSGE